MLHLVYTIPDAIPAISSEMPPVMMRGREAYLSVLSYFWQVLLSTGMLYWVSVNPDLCDITRVTKDPSLIGRITLSSICDGKFHVVLLNVQPFRVFKSVSIHSESSNPCLYIPSLQGLQHIPNIIEWFHGSVYVSTCTSSGSLVDMWTAESAGFGAFTQ